MSKPEARKPEAESETQRCPHCQARYRMTCEVAISHDAHAADCQVCGKPMVAWSDPARRPRYELLTMPDGTDV
jgi:transcription elongation factor Elf1